MKYKSTIGYLYGLQKYGMKFGLDNITRLMTVLGDPHKSFRTIHVAGTNGKGSTSAMIESMLRTGGARTGLFTSPHLVSFTERIRINGKEIDESAVVETAHEVKRIVEKTEDFSPTFFEVVTAMAFLYFRKMKIDWAVVETGMGGRLDATNIVLPEATVITVIGLDHGEFLGRTLKEITAEKAGIVKDNIPVITATQEPEVMKVIEDRASEKNAALFKYSADFSSELISDNADCISFNYSGKEELKDLKLPLPGAHQMINASTAVKTIEVISDRFPLLTPDIRRGLGNVKWPGRLEMIKDDPPILIDGAHNPHAAYVLSLHLKKLLGSKFRRIILVIGIMGDKDIRGILKPLLPLASETIFTSALYGRAASPDVLAAYADSMGYPSRKSPGVFDALNLAESLYGTGDLIVVTGSFYTIGEAKESLGHKGVLARLRE